MSPRSGNIVAYTAAGLVALMVIAGAFNSSFGPVRQESGIVESFGFVPRDGPADKIFMVRLESGPLVEAWANTTTLARVGDRVRIDVYRRGITGAESYAVVPKVQ